MDDDSESVLESQIQAGASANAKRRRSKSNLGLWEHFEDTGEHDFYKSEIGV